MNLFEQKKNQILKSFTNVDQINQIDDLENFLEKGKKHPEGYEATWGGKKYKKTGGKWVPVGEGRGENKKEKKSLKRHVIRKTPAGFAILTDGVMVDEKTSKDDAKKVVERLELKDEVKRMDEWNKKNPPKENKPKDEIESLTKEIQEWSGEDVKLKEVKSTLYALAMSGIKMPKIDSNASLSQNNDVIASVQEKVQDRAYHWIENDISKDKMNDIIYALAHIEQAGSSDTNRIIKKTYDQIIDQLGKMISG